MPKKYAKAGDIALGGRVCCLYLERFAYGYISYPVVQQHYRLGTKQAGGVQNVIRCYRHA